MMTVAGAAQITRDASDALATSRTMCDALANEKIGLEDRLKSSEQSLVEVKRLSETLGQQLVAADSAKANAEAMLQAFGNAASEQTTAVIRRSQEYCEQLVAQYQAFRRDADIEVLRHTNELKAVARA